MANVTADVPSDRFRIFRQRLLILLSTCVAVAGIALIILSQFTTGNLHEDLVGVGAAVFAIGPITVMVWWVTDEMYRGALGAMLRDVVTTGLAESSAAMSEQIKNSGSAIESYLAKTSSITRDCQELGVAQVHLTRTDALNRFSLCIRNEIGRAEHGQPGVLWFVCASLRGFLDIETNKFNPQALIRAAAAQPTLDLRILMADPEYTVARSGEQPDAENLRRSAYETITRLQRDYGVPAASIRLYAFRLAACNFSAYEPNWPRTARCGARTAWWSCGSSPGRGCGSAWTRAADSRGSACSNSCSAATATWCACTTVLAASTMISHSARSRWPIHRSLISPTSRTPGTERRVLSA